MPRFLTQGTRALTVLFTDINEWWALQGGEVGMGVAGRRENELSSVLKYCCLCTLGRHNKNTLTV